MEYIYPMSLTPITITKRTIGTWHHNKMSHKKRKLDHSWHSLVTEQNKENTEEIMNWSYALCGVHIKLIPRYISQNKATQKLWSDH
jgi:hypothetical protein